MKNVLVKMLEKVCKSEKVSAHMGSTSIRPVLVAGIVSGIETEEGLLALLRFVRMNRETSTTETFPEMVKFFGERIITVGVKPGLCIPAYTLWQAGKTYADLEQDKVA